MDAAEGIAPPGNVAATSCRCHDALPDPGALLAGQLWRWGPVIRYRSAVASAAVLGPNRSW